MKLPGVRIVPVGITFLQNPHPKKKKKKRTLIQMAMGRSQETRQQNSPRADTTPCSAKRAVDRLLSDNRHGGLTQLLTHVSKKASCRPWNVCSLKSILAFTHDILASIAILHCLVCAALMTRTVIQSWTTTIGPVASKVATGLVQGGWDVQLGKIGLWDDVPRVEVIWDWDPLQPA